MSSEEWGKIVIIFEVDNSPYSHADNRKKISSFLEKEKTGVR